MRNRDCGLLNKVNKFIRSKVLVPAVILAVPYTAFSVADYSVTASDLERGKSPREIEEYRYSDIQSSFGKFVIDSTKPWRDLAYMRYSKGD